MIVVKGLANSPLIIVFPGTNAAETLALKTSGLLAQFLYDGPNQPPQKPRNSAEEDFAASGVVPPAKGPSPTVPRAEIKVPDDPIGAENVKIAGQNIPISSVAGEEPVVIDAPGPMIHWSVWVALAVLVVAIIAIRRVMAAEPRSTTPRGKSPTR